MVKYFLLSTFLRNFAVQIGNRLHKGIKQIA